jgi:hypothetical protein
MYNWAWWSMFVIPALRRLSRTGDHEFKASLDYTIRPCLKKPSLKTLPQNNL